MPKIPFNNGWGKWCLYTELTKSFHFLTIWTYVKIFSFSKNGLESPLLIYSPGYWALVSVILPLIFRFSSNFVVYNFKIATIFSYFSNPLFVTFPCSEARQIIFWKLWPFLRIIATHTRPFHKNVSETKPGSYNES